MNPDIKELRAVERYVVVEPLPGLARITTDDAADLDPGKNAALDRICDGLLNGTSFVGV